LLLVYEESAAVSCGGFDEAVLLEAYALYYTHVDVVLV
jgi:hypothetical protein